MKKQRPASVIGLLTQLVKQTREFYQWTTRQMAGPGPAMPPGPQAGVVEEREDGPARDKRDVEATKDGADTAPPGWEERTPGAPPAPAPVSGNRESREAAPIQDYKNRIDVAWNRIGSRNESEEELQEMLEKAVGMLETLSAHPGIRDYAVTKRRLEEIEQRLGYGSYPQ